MKRYYFKYCNQAQAFVIYDRVDYHQPVAVKVNPDHAKEAVDKMNQDFLNSIEGKRLQMITEENLQNSRAVVNMFDQLNKALFS